MQMALTLFKITTVINLFITYGDVILSEEGDYDHLYYELIRQSKVITTFGFYGRRFLTKQQLLDD